jgi:hypothetical protein
MRAERHRRLRPTQGLASQSHQYRGDRDDPDPGEEPGAAGVSGIISERSTKTDERLLTGTIFAAMWRLRRSRTGPNRAQTVVTYVAANSRQKDDVAGRAMPTSWTPSGRRPQSASKRALNPLRTLGLYRRSVMVLYQGQSAIRREDRSYRNWEHYSAARLAEMSACELQSQQIAWGAWKPNRRRSGLRGIAPCLEHKINVFADRSTSFVAIVAARQELILPRVTVANVSDYGEGQRFLFE